MQGLPAHWPRPTPMRARSVPSPRLGNAVDSAVWKVTFPSTFWMIWWMCRLSTVTEPKRFK
jgi:hypothetical protein